MIFSRHFLNINCTYTGQWRRKSPSKNHMDLTTKIGNSNVFLKIKRSEIGGQVEKEVKISGFFLKFLPIPTVMGRSLVMPTK